MSEIAKDKHDEYMKLDNILAELEKIGYAKIYSKLKLKEIIKRDLKLSKFRKIKDTVSTLKGLLLESCESRNSTLKIITQYRNMINKIINKPQEKKAVCNAINDFITNLNTNSVH